MSYNNKKFNNIFNRFVRKDKKHILCRNVLHQKHNFECKCKCNELCKYNHNINNEIKGCYYKFFDYLNENNLFIEAIKEIIKYIKSSNNKVKNELNLTISNWYKINNKIYDNKDMVKFLSISEFIIVGMKHNFVFQKWQFALAKETIRRNTFCKKHKIYICKKYLNLRINKSDICTGGINCKHGLHIKDLSNYTGNIPEAIAFKKNNFSIINFLNDKEKLLKKDNLNLDDLVNSFIFDLNFGVSPKIIRLNRYSQKRKLSLEIDDKFIPRSKLDEEDREEYELSLIQEVLSSVESKLKRCYTPSKFDSVKVDTDEIAFISRPFSKSPMMNLRKDLLKTPEELSDISDNSSFLNLTFNLNDMISYNNKYIESH